MKHRLLGGLLLAGLLGGVASAQRSIQPLPKEALAAKTVAIVNRTHNEEVEEGARAALRRWGRFTVVEDSDVADITLIFEKKSEHEEAARRNRDDGKPSSSFSITFSSSVRMSATVKGADRSFTRRPRANRREGRSGVRHRSARGLGEPAVNGVLRLPPKLYSLPQAGCCSLTPEDALGNQARSLASEELSMATNFGSSARCGTKRCGVLR